MEDPDASIIGLKNNRKNDGTIRKGNERERERERDKKDSKGRGRVRKRSKEEKS